MGPNQLENIYMIIVLILHAIIKKLVQNNFYQVQLIKDSLINNIWFKKKERNYDQLVNLILFQPFKKKT